jgi:adenylosuccinate synthase
LPTHIIILSGHVGAGKTTLAQLLVERFGAVHIKTHDLLSMLGPSVPQERRSLQVFGESLDKKTKGAWVRDGLKRLIAGLSDDSLIVLDSARIPNQVEAIRAGYGRNVVHVHLTADYAVLTDRYRNRSAPRLKELSSYTAVRKNKTEQQVEALAPIADVLIRTDRTTPADVLVRVASHVGLYGRENRQVVDVIIGGDYGSEGKGQIAAYLAPEYDLLVRVGGPNAGHSVYEDPTPYIFHHLPSGSRASKAHLMIGPGAMLYVPELQREIADCRIEHGRLAIDPQAMIILESDRRKEMGLQQSIGSTGRGVGSATARRIVGRGVKTLKLARDIKELAPYVRDTHLLLEDAFCRGHKILLEGTQGTGLSLFHGHYPHVTSRDTTVSGCLAEAGIAPARVRKVIMVCRTYPIRVENPEKADATSGPMSCEIDWATVAKRSGHDAAKLEENERTSTTQRRRRVGEFDWTLLRKSATLNAPSDVAMTFVDYIVKTNERARRLEQLSEDTIRFIEEVERVASAPVSLIATRFHSRSIIDRRTW